MNVELDKTQAAENNFDTQEPEQKTEKQDEDEVLEAVQNDPFFLKRSLEQTEASQINLELSQEIYAILTEMEGNYYSSSGNDKYLDWDTNNSIPYKVLRRLGETEPARLIKNKRRYDFTQYARIPREDGVERGFRLKFKNINYKPDKYEKTMLEEWEQKVVDKFFFPANEFYPNLSKFLGNAYEDYFDYDDITLEIRRNALRRPIAIHLADPRMFKPIIPDRGQIKTATFNDMKEDIFLEPDDEFMKYAMNIGDENARKDKPAYLLIHEGRRIMGVNRKLVRKHHFFTRSDFRKAGRGFSICEQGMSIATHIINSLKMNASNFTNNRMPKGFIHFSGGVGTLQLEKLKKLLYAHMSGTNPNRVPMISTNGEKGNDAKWVGIGGTSRDMEYHIWISLLFSIWCQLSGTDPRELSLGTHADAVGKKSLFEESSDGIIKESKDLGAKTFLLHIADSLNVPDETTGKNLFQELTGMDLECEFFGFEMQDKKLKQDILKAKLETDLSVNEILAANDQEPETLEFGGVNIYDIKAVGHPIIQQVLQALNQQKQQEDMMNQQNAQQTQTPEGEMTPDDKALIDKYKGSDDVEIEPGVDEENQNNKGKQ